MKNVNYSVLETALGGNAAVNSFSNSMPSESNVNSFLSSLRNNLPNTQITTYTYKPLTGMTSMTDAKGQATYYEYDNFQRLKSVKDSDGHVLKSFDYHYKP